MPVTQRPRLVGISFVLALVIAGSGALTGPVASAADVRFDARPWLELGLSAANQLPFLDSVAQVIAQPTSIAYGSDGRLTVLLVGSDHRDGDRNGERLDSIMVMSINPNTHQMAALSIPRDTARIPIPPALGGGTYWGRINGVYKYFKKLSGGSRAIGLEKFRQVIAYVLQVPIDYVAFIRFEGFDALVDNVDGVYTKIPLEIRDTGYIDKPGWPKGAKFLANTTGLGALLRGAEAPRCYGGYPKPVDWSTVPNCTRALVYVRSRKGRVGDSANNDYKRARRQQDFVFDAIRRVIARDDGANLSSLRNLATSAGMVSEFYTTLPSTWSDALAMYNLLRFAYLPDTRQVVLKPTEYATRIPGTYVNELKLSVVRTLAKSWFGPV